ncbi:MAG: CxxC-x17-CxxC domain-containing protein [Candidatus Micrarchaeota archaeon]
MKRFDDDRGHYGHRPHQNTGPRQMHKAVCSDCGQECEVPFEPREGKPVYCRECFTKRRSRSESNSSY